MNNKFSNLGWIVAACLAGIMIAGGFQGATPKFATADMDQIVQKSDYWKVSEASFKDYSDKRSALLQYIDRNGVMEEDQLKQLVDLTAKDDPTPAEKAQLEKVKSDVTAEEQKREALAVKSTPLTTDETNLMRHYQQRAEANTTSLQVLEHRFNDEISAKHQSIMNEAIDRAKKAIQTVGKAQGYTVVFTAAAAPYAANDVTADATTAMNAQK